MITNLLRLFYEFFKIGLFAIGGGMAAIPFLQKLAETTHWYSSAFITDMIAISESTPGPIGINMATYVGYNVANVLGGVVATLGTILPAIIIVTVVSKYLEKFRGSKIVDNMFYGLRPAVTGLIAAAGYGVMEATFLHISDFAQSGYDFTALVDPVKLLFFIAAFIAIRKFKKHPVLYIAVSAVVGLVLAF